jgi:hypothetical protein
METALTILFAPTTWEMEMIAQTFTVGRPSVSMALVIAAPQRVQLPHVDVRITPSTPLALSSLPISWPNRVALATEAILPAVA